MKIRSGRWFKLLTVFFTAASFGFPAQAAMLDVGPTVPQVLNSSEPNLGHGFPLWYRDTNRLPLELCMDQAMCFFAPPNPAAAVSFPGNMPDEAFWWAAESIITLPGVNQRAILVQALEAAFSTGDVVPDKQITFARMRIRIDTPVAGTYLVTTPYKQYSFTVANDPAAIADGIFFTEDIGIAEGGVFTGALAGTFGPFLYCANAPIVTATGSYLGDGVPCPVLGSPFTDPLTGQPANLFRVQGPDVPGSFGTVSSNLFSVNGKIYTGPIPTPLTVDKATYTLDSAGMQVRTFATTQPLSNQTTGLGTFPSNFTLTGVPSALQLTGAGIPTQALMSTNDPVDGKFFSVSGVFAASASLPATVTVTNTADIPPTAKVASLVDEVVITEASYNSANHILKVIALSGDKLAPTPTLTVSMKDGQQDVPLGTLAGGGQLVTQFPFTYNIPIALGGGIKSYNIPPESVSVTSTKGGSNTVQVTGPLNHPPAARNDAATVAPGQTVTINLTLNDIDSDIGDTVVASSNSVALASPNPTKGSVLINPDGSVTYSALPASSGTDFFGYTVQDTFGAVSNVATVTVTINTPPVAGPDSSTTPEDTPVVIDVAGNDTDADGNLTIARASVQVVTQPAHGTATALGNGSIRYTPALNYNGPDTFQYTVSDVLGAVSTAAPVAINVTPVADPPLAQNESVTTPMNLSVTINALANDSQPDGLSLVPATLQIVTNPLHGTATVIVDPLNVNNRLISYAPAANFFGTDSFTYLVRDNAAVPAASAPATVTVTVTPVNIPPVAVNDVATTFAGVARTIPVIANDTDADGTIAANSVLIVTPPANGTATAITTGVNAGWVTYTPNTGFAGTDTFTYNVKDNTSAVSSTNATVTVSVASVITDAVNVLRAQFDTSKNAWDVQGNTTNLTTLPMTVTIHVGSNLTGQTIGTATVAADGRWKFQLPGNTGNVTPDATRTISVSLPSGASRLAFPVAVK